MTPFTLHCACSNRGGARGGEKAPPPPPPPAHAGIRTTTNARGASTFTAAALVAADPRADPAACGLDSPGSVCNPSGLLSADGLAAVEETIDALAYNARLDCGAGSPAPYQLAVSVVDRMAAGLTAADAARSIHDGWGVGDAACQTGIVLFVAVGDRQLWFSTGKGARAVITDGIVKHLYTHMKPFLRAGDVDGAVAFAVSGIRDVLEFGEESGTYKAYAEWQTWDYAALAFALTIAGFVLLCVVLNPKTRKQRTYEECRERLRAIEAMRDANDPNAFRDNATLCPICLEPFPAAGEGDLPNNAAAGASPEPPTTLQCGHKFCTKCIVEWMTANNTCPVCRQASDVGPRLPSPPTRNPFVSDSRPTTTPIDLHFYLSSARRRYPQFVTTDLVSTWGDPQYASSFVRHTTFTRFNPALSFSSSSSSSSSWGGGSSFSGGGGGGGW